MPRTVIAGYDRGFTHDRMTAKRRFNFGQFHAVTQDLHLPIDPPQKLDIAVGHPSPQVASLVQSGSLDRGKRIGDELSGGQVRPIPVAPRSPTPPR